VQRLDGFPLGDDARRDPFDAPRLDGMPEWFVYVSGRGQGSWLFPAMDITHIEAAAAATVPMGYTDLWVLERLAVVPPPRRVAPGDRRAAGKSRLAGSARRPDARVLLREDGRCLGWAPTPATALRAARGLAVAHQQRILIGRLIADLPWH
jgi:hypothetical protein